MILLTFTNNINRDNYFRKDCLRGWPPEAHCLHDFYCVHVCMHVQQFQRLRDATSRIYQYYFLQLISHATCSPIFPIDLTRNHILQLSYISHPITFILIVILIAAKHLIFSNMFDMFNVSIYVYM